MRLPVMRLVTYDRAGARRLGAWVEGEVVDLPDAVGHPVFPTTLEAFVARNGGTTLDAARHALGRPGALAECAVADARLLTPLFPLDPVLPLLDPEAVVPWPEGAKVLRPGPHLACIVGRRSRDVPVEKAASMIFGYTLINVWSAYGGRRRRFAESIGPSVVTAEEFDPSLAGLVCRVDGGVWSKGRVSEDAFAAKIAEFSAAQRGLRPGDLIIAPFGTARGPRIGLSAGPGSVVEVEAEGIGILRNRLEAPRAIATTTG
jgi:2-keto-4-pentenoate hydratase/2-oxohepta-3-ene-1,7-dioic acid hydratase in catechol pathway